MTKEWIKVGQYVSSLRSAIDLLVIQVSTITPRGDLYLDVIDLCEGLSNLEDYLKTGRLLVLSDTKDSLLDLSIRFAKLQTQTYYLLP